MIIDMNVHWLPENIFTDKSMLDTFLNCVPCAYGEYAGVTDVPGSERKQIIISKPEGYVNLNYVEGEYDIDVQVKEMDEAGIDIGILRIPCWQEWLPLESCKMVNDGLAAHVKKYPNRFRALAVAPPWGTKEAIYEVERCIKELGFVGVQVSAHYGSLYLDEKEFEPYFEKLNQMDVPVVVHHTPLPVDYQSVLPYNNLRRLYGRLVDQGTAVGREIYSDLFDKYPNLKLVHTMLGGAFFGFANVLVPPKAKMKDELTRFDEEMDRVRGHLDNNIFFDVTHAPPWGKTQLECAVKVMGADHLLYGGSYPLVRDWYLKGADFIRSLDISEAEKTLVLGGNAEKLFKIGS